MALADGMTRAERLKYAMLMVEGQLIDDDSAMALLTHLRGFYTLAQQEDMAKLAKDIVRMCAYMDTQMAQLRGSPSVIGSALLNPTASPPTI